MTALAAEKATVKLPGPRENDFVGTDADGLPIAASVKCWAGGLLGLNSAGNVEPFSTKLGLVGIGVANITKDNTSGLAAALKVPTRAGNGAWGPFVNSSTSITSAMRGQICYGVDDQTLHATDGAGTRSPAGFVEEVTSDGVYISFKGLREADPVSTDVQSLGRRVVRCCIHTNIADLAAATVASRDGLTLVQGDRVLLIGQTTASQNGLYVVGAVATGAAPLTRPADWATNLVLGGHRIAVTAGTIFAGIEIQVTNATTPTIDTTTVTMVPVRQTGSATLVDGTVTVDTTVWLTSGSKITYSRKTVAGVPGPCLVCPSGTRTAGLPGTGAFVITAGTLADPVVATNTDDGTIDYEILG